MINVVHVPNFAYSCVLTPLGAIIKGGEEREGEKEQNLGDRMKGGNSSSPNLLCPITYQIYNYFTITFSDEL